MHELLDPTKNPLTYAIPFFLLSIALELAALKWLDHDESTGYNARDAGTSIGMGAISLVFTTIFKLATFVVFLWAYDHLAPWHLRTDTWWYWVLVIAGLDLCFYTVHRFVHRVNLGWAAHQAHHSSEYMNFGTALRQKWNP
ncbi:MAG TPA: sterol desaturase family protein, partial [Nocardioides sp.]|nr:sterol desaturase family protein [Nocardioides sp.]